MNPAVYHQAVALEVPEGDLVDFDIYVTSFHRFVLKNSEQNIYNMEGLMRKYNPAEPHQIVALEVPEDDLVDSDIHETSLYRFVLRN